MKPLKNQRKSLKKARKKKSKVLEPTSLSIMRLYRTYTDPKKKGYSVDVYIPSDYREFKKSPLAKLEIKKTEK